MPSTEPVRIDKWLWAARFYKTRSQATDAVRAGHVHHGGTAAKASKDVGPGDELRITVGQQRFHVVVKATAQRRGSAPQAQLLYDETPESREAREARNAERKLAFAPGADLGRRPTKRDRRAIEKARRGGYSH